MSERAPGPTPARQWWRELDTFVQRPSDFWREHAWVFVLALAVVLPFVGSFGLWDPWETHYGEVGRQITERNDWISTWWGSHWVDSKGGTEGSYFYSKPILLMWMMAIGMELFGVNAFAVRLGVALTGALGILSVYAFGVSVFTRRAGALMALVLASSPFWFMLGRQAQTDMPFVGMMTVGMCFFMMGAFGKDRDLAASRVTWGLGLGWIGVLTIPQISLVLIGLSRWRGADNTLIDQMGTNLNLIVMIFGGMLLVSGLLVVASMVWNDARRKKLALGAVLLTWGPLFIALLGVVISAEDRPMALLGWFIWGPTQAAIYASCLLGVLYLTLERPTVSRGRIYMLTFYAFIGLATLAKGLLGFMLPGAVLFLYILTTREWGLLKRVEFWRGVLVFIAVAFPWYAAMLIRHHPGFWNRFFVHDHFKRLTSGVHQLTTGSFEHFLRWLGYGLFPWVGFVPAAIARFFGGHKVRLNRDEGRASLMLLLWALVAFTLFTLSSTKFHHYIFPVVPALAMLVALALDDLLDGDLKPGGVLFGVGALIAAVIAVEIVSDPQTIKNLFSYRYDREWNHEAWDPYFQMWLRPLVAICVVGALGTGIARSARFRRISVGAMVVGGLGMAYFGLNVYMPTISSTMSQKQLWDRYYELCTEVEPPPGADRRKTYCEEPVIAFRLNWRGEVYHTHNLVIPIRSNEDWEKYKKEQIEGPIYAIMQNARYRGEFQRKLPERWKGKACLVHNDNLKFVLAKIPCAADDPDRVDRKENEGGDDAER
ncbi:hypothetical protein DL240_06195 [Lujinxingia litoralis]|uniref:Glycosyltransferase RgtA/B/C/D-like domain-containing protein n=1 Tax=Lujinxingia litoralis TaxID=2211119 RepID=A0A328C9S9_9DELT|nr:glycosyltransferase family 39 protein [Lujinxingia litoralis]RAL23744.1 hypothetical protein DL240_06195 [Lujinxingia litoralis]